MTDTSKLESAVAYLAGKLSPGKVKLFKLLYLADFECQAATGQSITGETYENFEMGPVPITLWKNFRDIIGRCAAIRVIDTGVEPEQRIVSKPGYVPRLSMEERSFLDGVVERFGSMSGNQLRDYSHNTIPFRASARGETIEYRLAAYLEYRKPVRGTVDQLLRDEELVARLREALHGPEHAD